MKITDIIALARKKAHANSTTFPDADMLLYFKARVPQYQADIEKVNEGYAGSIQYRTIKATGDGTWTQDGNTYLTREYNLPADILDRLDHVYAKLDGTNWIPLVHYDRIDINTPFKEENIEARFSNEEGVAGYTIFRSSLMLLTGDIPSDITNGLEIWSYSFTDLFTSIPVVDSADDVEFEVYGIPEQLQELLAIDLALMWKSDNEGNSKGLTKDEQLRDIMYSKRLQNLKNMDRSKKVSFQRPNDGYDNGFNL